MNDSLLVTGGAGYIGSHTLIELISAGYRPVVVDNYANSSPDVLSRVESLTGCAIERVQADVRDAAALDAVFERSRAAGKPIRCVIHFAALKAVGESVQKPLDYYDNNICGTLSLLQAMERAGVDQIIFSSSATVYGEPEALPYVESHRIAPTNPYGQTKAMVEQILSDWCLARAGRTAIALRYFNPIGAHASGLIGEAPSGIPNNLFPYIAQVAVGKREKLQVFGDDYDTVDGTGVRDYLHVVDLARGHVKAADFAAQSGSGFVAINLGTGTGTSVLQLMEAFEHASDKSIPYAVVQRRPGDVAAAWADASLAKRLLGWSAELSIQDMCRDGWRWQSQNPDGYSRGK